MKYQAKTFVQFLREQYGMDPTEEDIRRIIELHFGITPDKDGCYHKKDFEPFWRKPQ